MNGIKICCLLLLSTLSLQGQLVDPLPILAADPNYDLTPNPNIDETRIDVYIDLSNNNRHLPKVIQVDPVVISQDLQWPEGAWGRGLFSDTEAWKNDLFVGVNDCAQPSLDGSGTWTGTYFQTRGYRGTHPFTHISSKMLRAHIHAANLYGEIGGANNDVNNYEIIKHGLDHLIDQQRPDGSYTYWWFRPSKNIPNITSDYFPVAADGLGSVCNNQNPAHSYQTSYALRALSQGKHFLIANGINYARMPELEQAIDDAAQSLLHQLDQSRLGDYGVSAYNCWISNSNYTGLMAWALASAYKATGNCDYLDGAMWLCNKLFIQNHSGGLADGTWETPYVNPGDNDGCGNTVYHDTYIHYHMLTLRGLIETFDALPNTSDFYHYKEYLKRNIIKGVNHVINKRLSYYDVSSTNALPPRIGNYRLTYLATNGSTTCPKYVYYIGEDIIEPIATLALYARDASRHGTHFSAAEQQHLKNMLIVMGKPLGHPNWAFFPTVATYSDYFDAIVDFDNNQPLRRIFPRPGDCTAQDIVSAGRSFPGGLPNSLPFTVSSNGTGARGSLER